MPKNIVRYGRDEKYKKYRSVSEFLEAVLEYGKSLDDEVTEKNKLFSETKYIESLSIWFRGQANAAWDLVPGVYRGDFAASRPERLYKERLMAKDFKIAVTGILEGNKSNTELYFLQQHYGMPTRLLDWTSNALAALFFAVSSSSGNDCKCCKNKNCAVCEETDCAVYMMNAYATSRTQNNGKNQYEGIDFDGLGSSQNTILNKVLEIIYRWNDELKFPDFVMPVYPDQIDSRIRLQSGCFTFHVPERPKFTNNENSTLRQFIIDKKKKRDILDSLLLMGVNEFSIYGDMENLSKKLNRVYSKKLSDNKSSDNV